MLADNTTILRDGCVEVSPCRLLKHHGWEEMGRCVEELNFPNILQQQNGLRRFLPACLGALLSKPEWENSSF